ncbi:MAG: RNA-binding S4 domain-containing protein [Oscillospiraceae bacterium]|nr:RNA-binding S4 domain-containing protein [Oscillospiraceae bacterium]
MEIINITTEFIKLQDLMKLANMVETGGEAKILIQNCQVTVDGEPCLQRGKKIRPGNIVSFNNQNYSVAYADQ